MIDLKNRHYELRRIVASMRQPEPFLKGYQPVAAKTMAGLAREVTEMAGRFVPHPDCAKVELWEQQTGDEFDFVAVVAEYGKRSATPAAIKKAIARERRERGEESS